MEITLEELARYNDKPNGRYCALGIIMKDYLDQIEREEQDYPNWYKRPIHKIKRKGRPKARPFWRLRYPNL